MCMAPSDGKEQDAEEGEQPCPERGEKNLGQVEWGILTEKIVLRKNWSETMLNAAWIL